MRWKEHARQLKREPVRLYFAARDPRTPWYARLTAGLVVAYVLSPIDLIPDFVPVLGYLDDAILIPCGVLLVRRMIPKAVLDDCRTRAATLNEKPISWMGAAIIVMIWLLAVGLTVTLLLAWLR